MFVIMFYDVGEKRVNKVLKTARKYLTWIQNSVLEGELTPATLEALKVDVKNIIDMITPNLIQLNYSGTILDFV